MSQQERIDKILDAIEQRAGQDVGALLGADFSVTGNDRSLVSKESAFDLLKGKQISAQLDIVGDVEGKGALLVSIKDGIRLGGTLIMLPEPELEECVGREEYSEEIEDSYGEIANIVAGAISKDFEEMFSKSCRFVRKEQEVLVPVKIDIESDQPVVNETLYMVSMSMTLAGKQMGEMVLLIPAVPFELASEELAGDTTSTSDNGKEATNQADDDISENNSEEQATALPVQQTGVDSEKQKKRIDKLLEEVRQKMQEEVSALLGNEVKFSNLENRVIDKEEFFFDEVSGKQVLADFEVVGELEGVGYFSIGIKDAIRIGGELIMLPASELEKIVNDEEFSNDSEDAYGEVANIAAGVYTAVFEENYNKQIRFVKKELHQIAPMKVDLEGPEPIPADNFYMSSMELGFGEENLGKVYFLMPLDLFELSGLPGGAEQKESDTVSQDTAQKNQTESPQNSASGDPKQQRASNDGGAIDILLVGDDASGSESITRVLTAMGYGVRTLTFKDDVHSYIPGQLKAVYLVMRDVNEQAFGAAIKISTSCQVPIIAAGPEWTRSKVIKAVKYGVRDILLTPAKDSDIEENVSNNLLKMAA